MDRQRAHQAAIARTAEVRPEGPSVILPKDVLAGQVTAVGTAHHPVAGTEDAMVDVPDREIVGIGGAEPTPVVDEHLYEIHIREVSHVAGFPGFRAANSRVVEKLLIVVLGKDRVEERLEGILNERHRGTTSVAAKQAWAGRHERKQLAYIVEQHGVAVEIDRARATLMLHEMRNVEPSSNASALIIESRGGNVHIAPIEVIALGAAKLRQFSYFDAQPGQTARRDIGEQENTRVWIEISGAFERCSKVRGNCAGVKIHDGWVSVHAMRSRADQVPRRILSAVSASNVKSARRG